MQGFTRSFLFTKQLQKMNQLKKLRISRLLIIYFLVAATGVSAQDSTAPETSVNLRYFLNNNSLQYLLVQTRSKEGRKFQALPGRTVQIYLDSNIAQNLIAKTITDETGMAKIIIPPSLKDEWKNAAKHSFIAVMQGAASEEEKTSTLDISKTKIEIDTANTDGTRSVNVKVMMFANNDWVPAKDVEMKVGIERNGCILSAGDKETYTTDSTGTLTVEFKRDTLPGDAKGNFVLAAKVEDNDQYGNLLVEKTVPWGTILKEDHSFFDQRTLWTTRFKTPLWLLFTAYSIVISVWGSILYLVFQLIKIKKLGTAV